MLTRILKAIVLPFLIWKCRRRSRRDNRFTAQELERFAAYVKANPPKL